MTKLVLVSRILPSNSIFVFLQFQGLCGGNPDVHVETKKKIPEFAVQLNYEKNLLALNLREQKRNVARLHTMVFGLARAGKVQMFYLSSMSILANKSS
jgi:hypothetical protein